jgi:Bacterial lectin
MKSCIRRGLFAVASVGLAVPAFAGAGVDFPNFSSTAGLNLVGAAGSAGSALQLTQAAGSQAGAAWFGVKQDVASGFTTSFQFRINKPGTIGADGFAFVIQNTSATAIGANGGGIGYGSNPIFAPTAGITNSLAIEFDTYNNVPGWPDTAHAQHISIQTAGAMPNSPDTSFSLGSAALPDITTGSLHTVSVAYNPGSMAVFLDGVLLVNAPVNLASAISLDDGKAWLGFTASTGGAGAAQQHLIESWTLTQIPAPGSAALLGLGGLVAIRRRRTN